jgi:hypothetical protein
MIINKIFFSDTNKEGQPYIDKTGKHYKRASIMFQGQSKYASALVYEGSKIINWKEGDEVDVELEQNGDFLNVKVPSKVDKQIGDYNKAINIRIDGIERRLRKLEGIEGNEINTEVSVSEIPF